MGEENMLPNKQIILKNSIQGCPKESDFELRTTTISTELPDHQYPNAVLLKNMYLSCDPYLCHVMRPGLKSVFIQAPIVSGSVVKGYGVAKVVKSSYGELREGDYVWGITGWEDFSWNLQPQTLLIKIHTTSTDVPLSYYAGILGIAGLAAYAGWNEICCARRGESVYVSSAAGGVGHLVGQFAKMAGCYVVGSTSTNKKVDLLKTRLGFDDAFNYKDGDLCSNLNKCFPEGIDVYFDNVGGEMLNEVLPKMKTHGRIAACGMISQYNLDKPDNIRNMFHVIKKRLSLQGFSESDHKGMHRSYVDWAVEKLEGKELVYVEETILGLENAPSAFVGIFHGHNIGKRVVVITEST